MNPGAGVAAAEHLDLGELRDVDISGSVTATPGGLALDVQAPGPQVESGAVRLVDMLAEDPPYGLTSAWLEAHPRERRLLRELTDLARAAAWLRSNDSATDPPFHTAMGAQRGLLSLPTSWPTPSIGLQAGTIRTELENRLQRAQEQATDQWTNNGPAVWWLVKAHVPHVPWWLPRLADRALTGGRLTRDDRGRLEGATHKLPSLRGESRTIPVPETAGRRLDDLPPDPSAADFVDALLVETTTPWWTWTNDPDVGQWTVRVPDWCADLVESVHTPEPMTLTVAGQPIEDAAALVARYCGATGETWAWPYYDTTPIDPGGPSRVDLALVGLMHGPIRRADLEWFERRVGDFRAAVAALPDNLRLAEVPRSEIAAIPGLVERLGEGDASRRSIASKILHRHRPALVPIADRDIARRYARESTGKGRLPYADLVVAIASDLADPDNQQACAAIRTRADEPGLTDLRALDIAVWMDTHARD